MAERGLMVVSVEGRFPSDTVDPLTSAGLRRRSACQLRRSPVRKPRPGIKNGLHCGGSLSNAPRSAMNCSRKRTSRNMVATKERRAMPPLLGIAEAVGGDWPDRARQAAIELTAQQPPDNSLGVQLLASIRSMFENLRTDRLSSEAIVGALAEAQDSPWPDRRPPTKVQLARRLAPFGIRPTIVHRSRTQVSRGYLLEDCRDAFARYVRNPSARSGQSLKTAVSRSFSQPSSTSLRTEIT